MNPNTRPEADLEAALRASAALQLADEGFSTRVLTALPAPGAAPRYRWLIPSAGAAVGLVWVFARGASVADLGTAVNVTAAAASGSLLPGAAVLAVLAWFYSADEFAAE